MAIDIKLLYLLGIRVISTLYGVNYSSLTSIMDIIYRTLEQCSETRKKDEQTAYMLQLTDIAHQEIAAAHILLLDVLHARQPGYIVMGEISKAIINISGSPTKAMRQFKSWEEMIDWFINDPSSYMKYARTLSAKMRRLFATILTGASSYHIGEASIAKNWPAVNIAKMTRMFYWLPAFAHPDLKEPPNDLTNWIVQQKLDGHRSLLVIGKYTFMVTRNGGIVMYPDDWANHGVLTCKRDPTIEELREIQSDDYKFTSIFDGEMLAYRDGKLLTATNVPSIGVRPDIYGVYFVFDCLVAGGHDIREQPLSERLKQMKVEAAKYNTLKVLPSFVASRKDIYLGSQYEGYVLKNMDETYTNATWVKHKNTIENIDVLAWGYREGSLDRKIGAIMIAAIIDGKLVQYGAAAGISVAEESQFKILSPPDSMGVGLLERCMVEIRSNGMQDGKPRHPALVRLRPDLPIPRYEE